MRTCKVMLNTAADVTEFVRLVSGCAHEIGLANGRYLVNAKSIMGVLSMHLVKGSRFDLICTGDDEEKAAQVLEEFFETGE